MIYRRIIYRFIFLIITVFVIPIIPLLIIFIGTNSPEYVINGTLNMKIDHHPSIISLYAIAIKNLLLLNLGNSTSSGLPVFREIYLGYFESLKVIIPSILLSYFLGTTIGLGKIKRNKSFHSLDFLYYLPMVVFSYLFLFFSDKIGIDFTSNIKYIFAIIILSIYPIYIVSKSFSSLYNEFKDSDYYSFHISVGFSQKLIFRKYSERHFLLGYLSLFENVIIYLFGFIYFVESPFAINGIGSRFVFGIQHYDYPLIIGFCIVSLVVFTVINIIIEAIKISIDPRLK